MDKYAKWFVKDANFGSPSDLYLCLPRAELKKNCTKRGMAILVHLIFFDFARAHLFGDAPHSRLRCWDE